MNLRNALSTLFVLGLSFTLAAGQESEFSSTPSAPVSGTPDVRILFTGYLLGYYRAPDIQTGDFQDACPDKHDTESPAAATLKKEIEEQRKGSSKTILVGAGNNFAVQLFSRSYQDKSFFFPKARNSADVKWKLTPPGKSVGDNVACFLSLARYDALVPGKEDFYFGPERLRQIAKRMAAVPDPKKESDPAPVHMLAANLVVQTSYLDAPAKVPDSFKKLNFTPGLPDQLRAVEISDHATVLPFLRWVTVTRKKTEKPPTTLFLVPAHDGHPDEMDFGRAVTIPEPMLEPPDPRQPESEEERWDYRLSKASLSANNPESNQDRWSDRLDNSFLIANHNYGLCSDPKVKPVHCIRFSVAIPFFQACATQYCKNGQSNPKKDQEYDNLYTPDDYDLPFVYLESQNVVIFGIADPELESLVGRDNLSWKNTDDHLQTQVVALDPLKSLHQAMQLFKERHPGAAPTRVLLAELSRATAEELAENLGFDVIIAASRPYEHATTNRKIVLEADDLMAPKRKFRGIVVVPWRGTRSNYDPHLSVETKNMENLEQTADYTLFNPLRQLDLRSATDKKRVWEISGERTPIPESESWCAADALNQGSAQLMGWHVPPPSGAQCQQPTANDAFVNFTLKTIRETANADVAVMQKRDFYAGPFQAPSPVADDPNKRNTEAVERVLWTGDSLQVVTVTGDTLKKVLAESDAFDQRDLQATQENLEIGRGLFTLGMRKTEDGQYMVGGDLLDPKRLYTMATSNHITAGDTGYPELNDPQLADKKLPVPSVSNEEANRISEIVCVLLFSPSNAGCIRAQKAGFSGKDGNALFASSANHPTEKKPGWVRDDETWLLHLLDSPLIANGKDSRIKLEEATQNRRTWRISLVQASFSFQEVANDMSEKTRAALFYGFTGPGINGANAHQWQITKRAEAIHGGQLFDEYLRNQLDYSSQVTAQIAPALPSISRSKNRDQIDVGMFLHPFTISSIFRPSLSRQKEYPKLGFVFEPFRLDTPLAKEQLIVGPKSNEESLHLDRTQEFLARTGFRLENAKSHLEAGFEAGWERGALVTFLSGATSCPPLPAESPFNCLTGLTPPVHVDQVRETRAQRGLYIDYSWTTAIPFHKLQNIAQAQGDWYPFGPSNDNSSDTRMLYDISDKLSIPISSSFSFQPGADYFVYRNKYGVAELKRWTPSATLTWTFDWYSGGKFKSLGWNANQTTEK
jgi:2',3'-cyclic-nucleotide 2'-phosphodiesterase (5'-nucleotidase family)